MDGKIILNQLSAYKQGKQIDEVKKEYNLKRIVKLASNENPFGYSNKLKDQFSTIAQEFNIYPDGYTSHLRTALATKLNVQETELVFGSGSDEIIQTICRAYLYAGVNTVMATPTFPQYKHNALIEGADIKEIPTVEGHHDLDGMLQAIDENTKVVWLCSPDNPTGTIIPKESFQQFMKECPKNVLVVLDEAYYEYIDEQFKLDTNNNIRQYNNLIILRTFSKAYGLAGLRIGYGITNVSIASKLDVVRGPFNTTAISQKAALIALDDDKFIQETVVENRSVKHSFELFLDNIGLYYYESQTNFILVSTPVSGDKAFQYLLENGFIVRSGDALGYPNTIRITIGNKEDMMQLQELLENLANA